MITIKINPSKSARAAVPEYEIARTLRTLAQVFDESRRVAKVKDGRKLLATVTYSGEDRTR